MSEINGGVTGPSQEIDLIVEDMRLLMAGACDKTLPYIFERAMQGLDDYEDVARAVCNFAHINLTNIRGIKQSSCHVDASTPYGRSWSAVMGYNGDVPVETAACRAAEERFMVAARDGLLDLAITDRDDQVVAFRKLVNDKTVMTLSDAELIIAGAESRLHVPAGVLLELNGYEAGPLTVASSETTIFKPIALLRATSFLFPEGTFRVIDEEPWLGQPRDRRGLEVMRGFIMSYLEEQAGIDGAVTYV